MKIIHEISTGDVKKKITIEFDGINDDLFDLLLSLGVAQRDTVIVTKDEMKTTSDLINEL